MRHHTVAVMNTGFKSLICYLITLKSNRHAASFCSSLQYRMWDTAEIIDYPLVTEKCWRYGPQVCTSLKKTCGAHDVHRPKRIRAKSQKIMLV